MSTIHESLLRTKAYLKSQADERTSSIAKRASLPFSTVRSLRARGWDGGTFDTWSALETIVPSDFRMPDTHTDAGADR